MNRAEKKARIHLIRVEGGRLGGLARAAKHTHGELCTFTATAGRPKLPTLSVIAGRENERRRIQAEEVAKPLSLTKLKRLYRHKETLADRNA